MPELVDSPIEFPGIRDSARGFHVTPGRVRGEDCVRRQRSIGHDERQDARRRHADGLRIRVERLSHPPEHQPLEPKTGCHRGQDGLEQRELAAHLVERGTRADAIGNQNPAERIQPRPCERHPNQVVDERAVADADADLLSAARNLLLTDSSVAYLATSLQKQNVKTRFDTLPAGVTGQYDALTNEIVQHVESGGKATILLDGLEYLMINNDSPRIWKFLEYLNDVVAQNTAILIISIDERTFIPRDLALLERSAVVL